MLSFADTAYRTVITKTQQVWSKDGVSLINNKASATSDVANYSNPVRLYSGSSVTVEASGNITKIVFDCNSSSYATVLANSIGASASVSSDKVTVSLNGKSSSFTVAKLTAQVRLDSITVSCTEAEPACQHTNTVIDKAVAPTCTATGLSEGKHCADCGETITQQNVVAALGHTVVTDAAVAPTCTAPGLTEGKRCSVCKTVIVAQTSVGALGHSYQTVVLNPTCTQPGYTTHTCSCGETFVDSETAALGHTPSEWIVDTPAQIGVQGSQHKECTVCNETLETAVIEALTDDQTTESAITDVPAADDPITDAPTTVVPEPETESESQGETQTDSNTQTFSSCNGTVGALSILIVLTACCAVLRKKR